MLDNWIQYISKSFEQTASSFISYSPKVIGSILLLIIGFFVAKILSAFVYKLAKKLSTKFYNKLNTEDRLTDYDRVPKAASKILFWIIFVLFLIASVEALGLPAISNVLYWLAGYIPKLLAALVIILFGAWTGELTSSFIKKNVSEKTGIEQTEFIAEFAKWTILFITFTIALGQAGIESTLLITITSIGFAALFGAIGIAFALGARQTISNLISSFYIKKYFKVGDSVKQEKVEGKIVDITSIGVLVKTDSGYALIPAQKFVESITFYNYKLEERNVD